MRVKLGDVAVADVKAVQTAPFFCVFETPVMEAGPQTLAFEGHYFSGQNSRSVVFDDVKLSLVEAAPSDDVRIAVTNASFEWSEAMESADHKPVNALPNLSGAGWSFNSRSGIAEHKQNGMSEHGDFTFVGDAPPEGRRIGFIRSGGEISQSVNFPADGTYEISFAMARPSQKFVGTLQVTLDGMVVDGCEALCPEQEFFCRQVCTVTVTAGQHTLAFVGPADSAALVLLDAVEVRRGGVLNFADFEGAYGDIVDWDASHDSDKGWVRVSDEVGKTMGGWLFRAPSYERLTSVCGPSNYKFNGAELFENRVAVMLQNVAEVSRSGIVIPEPGVYELSFMTKSRGGNFAGRLYEVTWNGVRLGTVTTPSSKWKRMTFPIVVSRANETGTLAFRGLFVTGKEQSSAFIDGVQLRRLSDYAVSSVKPISEGAALELGADAKLELMYDGDVKVSTVRRGGRRVTGVGHVISAETCPDWVKGPGRLCVPQRGMLLLFR